MRRVLPQRRAAKTFDLRFWNHPFTVTVGFYADGTPGEVLIDGGKTGQDAQATARDAAVTLSLALQHGVPLMTIRRAITRGAHGEAASILGAIVDRLALMLPECAPGQASEATARCPAQDDRTLRLSIRDAEENTHALRGEVFTCESITPNAHGRYSGFILVHQDETGDMSAVPGHHYENLEDAEAAAALLAKRIGARYVILGVTA